MTLVNSQSSLNARLPVLPSSPPTNQGAWTAFMNTLRQWGKALQQPQSSPNVMPPQYQTFSGTAPGVPVTGSISQSNMTCSVDGSTQYFGTASLECQIAAAPGTMFFLNKPIALTPASRWYVAFVIKAPAGMSGTLSVVTNNSNVANIPFSVPAGGFQLVWGLADFSAFPDTAATWQIVFNSTGTVWIDGLQMNLVNQQTLADLPGFNATKPTLVGTDPLDVTQGQLSPKGSTPPIVLGASFSWTSPSGGNQVTITWPAFTLYRPDGSTTNIAAGAGTLVTGLTNGTTYTVYPYIVDGQTGVSFATGASGAVGSPAICYANGSAAGAQLAYANANVPLNSFTVAPTSGGGGGGGGHTGCMHPGATIELANGRKILARDLTVGVQLCGYNGPTKVTSIDRRKAWEWVRVYFRGGASTTVTLDHRFIKPDMTEVRAGALHLGDIIEGRKLNLEVVVLELLREECDLVAINVEHPHMYYLSGALSHNGNPKP